MVFELPLSVLQSKKLREALRCVYQFGYADTDFNDVEVLRYPNLAEFYVSAEGITVVVICYRPDYPMVVCTLQLPAIYGGIPKLRSDQIGMMRIPLHILKRYLADNIVPNHRLTLSGGISGEDNQFDIHCELTGPGQIHHFSLPGNPCEEGKVAESPFSFGLHVKVGFPPDVFRDAIVYLNQLGSSVEAVIREQTVILGAVNISKILSKAASNLEIEGENFPYHLTFNIQHWKTFCQASYGSKKIWLLRTRVHQRTMLCFPIDSLGYLLFTFH